MKGVDKEARPFMSAFTESQAFAQFIQDRVDRSPGDPEIMFFDEVIKAKINRSRFRLGKEDTKFLDDPSYGVQGTLKAIPPSGDIQVYDNDARRFPTTLDSTFL
ncbi:ARS-binding factor 1 [Mortierella claussenii]|nr:ARS-binding factor 1 [Mortierella claussenii]